MSLLQVIKKQLLVMVDRIDKGACDMSDEECMEVITYLQKLSNKEELMSKYQAYTYLNISRATFDRLVQEGQLPKGKHVAGLKELLWKKGDIISYLNKIKH